MYKLSICSIFKNESLILDEWISHYLYHGVEHFFLINDYSNDDYNDIITKYSQYITLMDNDIITKDVGRQINIYEKYFRQHINKTQWMAFIDLDEFLYSPLTINIGDILDKYNNYSQIIVDWLHFGSNNHKYQPHSVVEGFTQRAIHEPNKPYHSYKSIFQSKDLISFNVHSHQVKGNTIYLKYNENIKPDLIINHYAIQSLDFFIKIKSTRGDVNNWFEHQKLERNKQYFNSYDINEITDNTLYEQNKDIILPIKNNKLDLINDNVTLVITSCNRPHLLAKTLQSFVLFNTYPIESCIIIDDSGIINCNDEILKTYKTKLNIKCIYNDTNIGQLKSIDKVYSYVKTKYIFHCEEDWNFTKPNFIEKSMNIFKQYPEEKIFTVWLRPHNCTSLHPIIKDNLNRGFYLMDKEFSYMYKGVKYTWCGVTFNPGLRKTTDMYNIHPFTHKCNMVLKNGKQYPVDGEYTTNRCFANIGYYGVILDDPTGHVEHIGFNDHISVEY
jgi:hypothetical protein